ncbi:unnamed protein product [Calicophoron daubneyi]|uniref:Uncharacterized protein n=1 Tax=Calicophoron daubneyi TaxID=300641 RepID=A0AAV2TVS8_CALDB
MHGNLSIQLEGIDDTREVEAYGTDGKPKQRLLRLLRGRLVILKGADRIKGCVWLSDKKNRTRYKASSIHLSVISQIQILDSGKITIDLSCGLGTTVDWLEKDEENLFQFFRQICTEVSQNLPMSYPMALEPKMDSQNQELSRAIMCDLHRYTEQYTTTPQSSFLRAFIYYLDSFGNELPQDTYWYLQNCALQHSNRRLAFCDPRYSSEEILLSVLFAVKLTGATRYLQLDSMELSKECLDVIGGTLKKNLNLEKISASGCTFTGDWAEPLIRALSRGSQLCSLDLSNNLQINDQILSKWRRLTSRFGTNLRVLLLNGCGLSLHGVNSLASAMTFAKDTGINAPTTSPLTELNLSGNNLMGSKPVSFAQLLGSAPNLKILKLARCNSAFDWLPGTLIGSCAGTLEVLDISGNPFDWRPTKEWTTFFSSAASLKQLRMDNCHGLYLGDTLRYILSGLGRLKGKILGNSLHLGLSELIMGRSGADVLASNLQNLCFVISRLNLSRFDLGDAPEPVFKALELSPYLRQLELDGPWVNVDKKTEKTIVLSLTNFLSKPDCKLKSLSVASVGLGKNLFYLLHNLPNCASLEILDISGNKMGNDLARILSHILSVPSHLKHLDFDQNELDMEAIERITEAAENRSTPFTLGVPCIDLATVTKNNRTELKELLKRIENLHRPKAKASPSKWWAEWETSERIQLTVQCVSRLCANAKQIYESVVNGHPTESSELEEIQSWLHDGQNVRPILHQFVSTTQELNMEFLASIVQLLLTRLQFAASQHLERLANAVKKISNNLCPGQTQRTEKRVEDLARELLHGGFELGLRRLVLETIMPEVESRINDLSRDFMQTAFEVAMGEIIEGLDKSHQALLKRLRPARYSTSPPPHENIKNKWEEALNTPKESIHRRYPLSAYRYGDTTRTSRTVRYPTSMSKLQFRGLEIKMKPSRSSSMRHVNEPEDQKSMVEAQVPKTMTMNADGEHQSPIHLIELGSDSRAVAKSGEDIEVVELSEHRFETPPPLGSTPDGEQMLYREPQNIQEFGKKSSQGDRSTQEIMDSFVKKPNDENPTENHHITNPPSNQKAHESPAKADPGRQTKAFPRIPKFSAPVETTERSPELTKRRQIAAATCPRGLTNDLWTDDCHEEEEESLPLVRAVLVPGRTPSPFEQSYPYQSPRSKIGPCRALRKKACQTLGRASRNSWPELEGLCYRERMMDPARSKLPRFRSSPFLRSGVPKETKPLNTTRNCAIIQVAPDVPKTPQRQPLPESLLSAVAANVRRGSKRFAKLRSFFEDHSAPPDRRTSNITRTRCCTSRMTPNSTDARKSGKILPQLSDNRSQMVRATLIPAVDQPCTSDEFGFTGSDDCGALQNVHPPVVCYEPRKDALPVLPNQQHRETSLKSETRIRSALKHLGASRPRPPKTRTGTPLYLLRSNDASCSPEDEDDLFRVGSVRNSPSVSNLDVNPENQQHHERKAQTSQSDPHGASLNTSQIHSESDGDSAESSQPAATKNKVAGFGNNSQDVSGWLAQVEGKAKQFAGDLRKDILNKSSCHSPQLAELQQVRTSLRPTRLRESANKDVTEEREAPVGGMGSADVRSLLS